MLKITQRVAARGKLKGMHHLMITDGEETLVYGVFREEADADNLIQTWKYRRRGGIVKIIAEEHISGYWAIVTVRENGQKDRSAGIFPWDEALTDMSDLKKGSPDAEIVIRKYVEEPFSLPNGI
jgi:hypothetical protein